MRFFSRVALICNLCFIVSVIMRLVKIGTDAKGKGYNDALKVEPIISSIVVLGWIAIFVNIIFVIVFISRYPAKKMNNIPRWIVFFNIILMPMQVYYFFFSNF